MSKTENPIAIHFKEWVIRLPEDSDWDRVAEISNLDNDEPVTGDDLKRRYAMFPAEGRRFYEVATDSTGRVIGCARAIHRPGMAEGCFYCQIELDPEVRGNGLGAFLHKRIDEYFAQESAKTITFFVRETDEVSMKFATNRGYQQDRVLAESKLDLANFDSSKFMISVEKSKQAGLEIVDLNDMGDNEESWKVVHKLLCDSDDAPDIELWGHPTFSDFYENTRNAQWFTPLGILVAKWNGEFVGFHSAGPLPDCEGWTTDYTGVIPSARRKGIALALKMAGLNVAQLSGAKWIVTHNDSSNVGMLAINIALGFQMQPGYAQMRKWL